MLFSFDVRTAGQMCALLLALVTAPAFAEPATVPDHEASSSNEVAPADDVTLGDEPLDLTTPLPDGMGKTAKRPAPGESLERPVETKLGVNYRQSPPIPSLGFHPDPFVRNGFQGSGATPESTGVAWAHVKTPQLPFGWDSASFETQVDPLDDQGKVSGTLSRSLALGDEIAITVRNGYSTERSLAHGQSSHNWATNQSLRLNLLPTDTTLSLDASLSSGADHWLRTFSAEQKLFGGPFSVSGAVSETSNGDFSKSLKAGFKQNW